MLVDMDAAESARVKAEAAADEHKELVQVARAIVIHDAGDYEIATEGLKDIKGQAKALKEQRDGVVKPLKEAVKNIEGWFKPALKHLTEAESTIKGSLTAYHNDVLERQQKLLEEAAGSGDHSLIRQADNIEPPSVQGIQVRNTTKVEVEDQSLVPDEYKEVNMSLVRAAIKQGKTVPGIRVYKEANIAVKA